ncbi:CHASE domain-containing protein [Simiduia aestuariiviva]|uniref:histidine kinase n=1 Tax=Simiduia aestuariiviva TaxID=1510459 RepID=A0A839ULN1_9GAMM|nr:CHASE domain-containing protein [Simiduia aestuariiviva]MBB3167480.1 signal transduction histidine kinase/ActR/RegA family two-component response regulator [Simiduia aestuariiviva]
MHLLYVLLAAGAYYIAGRLGLMLAIPPGFASAIWPAAGIALACVMLLPRTAALLGIALGSFCLNLGVISNGFTALSWGLLPLPAMICVGAATQAGVAHWLYRRFLGEVFCIDTPRNIGYFLLLVSPLGCVIGASFGSSALLANGLINAGNLPFTWFTWWAGDTIGTMLFAPLLLTLLSQDKNLSTARRFSIALPTISIFMAIVLVFMWSAENRKLQIEQQLKLESADIFQAAEERLGVAQNLLKAYEAVIIGSESISADRFNAASSILLAEDDLITAVGWIPVLSNSDRPEFERQMQQQLGDAFRLTEIGSGGELVTAEQRSRYYPVQYIYPQQGNERAVGLNLGANASRLRALENAHALRRPVATQPLQLVQATETSMSVILYRPIYHHVASQTANANTTLYTPTRLLGFISGVFTFNRLFTDLIDKAKVKNFNFSLMDVTDRNQSIDLINNKATASRGYSSIVYTAKFGERTLAFTFSPDENFALISKDWSSWNILTFGFLLAALIQGFILLITGHTASVQEEVKLKTSELQKAKEQAEFANKAKTNFLANMSHELRTPLHAVTGLISLCMKTTTTPEQTHYLTKAKTAASALMDLINQTLDYSKIESGQFALDKHPFNLRESLKRIHAIFSTEAQAKNIDFIFDLPERAPERFIGDGLRVEQILLNICGNAIKFTSRGQVKLSLSISDLDQTGSTADLTFTVQDTGIGIDKAEIHTLFNAFHQADVSTTRKFGGTGLGLSICKKLAESMGGSIEIESELCVGTQVTVRLTLAVENPDASISLEHIDQQPQATTTEVVPDDYTQLLRGKNVLIVEDIPINQEIARFMMEDFGATVTLANNGVEALEIIKNTPAFDLVLMDIQMPEMDGIEATRQIRAQESHSNLPIIAMTANAVKNDVDASLSAGMNAHVAKPIDEVDLIEKIRKCLTETKQAIT